MSIFSSFRRSRQHAKDQSAKMAEEKQKESSSAPYKHVPTHAALDAISSAPPSWRQSDRPRILEQNRRRSAMSVHAQHASMPSIPRVGSSLSHVSYPANYASPVVRVPRTHSYTGGLTPYGDRSRDVIYSVTDETQAVHPGPWKGKEAMRPGPHSRGISPTSSKAGHSPVHSSSDSTSSQDDLEMRAARPIARPAVSAESVHRLHPSSRRRSSETSQERRIPTSPTKISVAPGASRDSRPPPSMRGFNYISAYTEPAPVLAGTLPGSLPGQYSIGPSSLRSSTASLSGQLSGQAVGSGPVTPTAVSPTSIEFPFTTATPMALTSDNSYSTDSLAKSGRISPSSQKDRRVPKTARFSDLERIDSHPESTRTERSRPGQRQIPIVAQEQIVNVLPEPVEAPQPAPAEQKGGKKLSKSGGGKLLKKSHRWSLSKSPAITA
ncbi:hypothetical protein HJFPF1_06293 [Paramyrothecium foliicola]|nr:hypothetical protein HJFPF1_06293 [Paramyrothecium foliicola]